FLVDHLSPTYLYTLSLHDALPIYLIRGEGAVVERNLVEQPVELAVPIRLARAAEEEREAAVVLREADVRLALQLAVDVKLRKIRDRKSTRLNSSHQIISYAVFCLK